MIRIAPALTLIYVVSQSKMLLYVKQFVASPSKMLDSIMYSARPGPSCIKVG